MKKIFVLILAILLCFLSTACGGSDVTTVGADENTTTTLNTDAVTTLPPAEPVPQCDHQEETIEGKAPTSVDTGLTEGKRCTLCGKITKVQDVIPPLSVISGLEYRLNEDRSSYTVVSAGEHVVNDELIIPHQFNGLPVTDIGAGAFKGNTSIKSLIIPSTVKYIEKEAFASCTEITEVTLNEGLIYIGSDAFTGCSSLKEIALPNTVSSTGLAVFANCEALEKAVISSSMEEINWSTFSQCVSLKTVVMPDSVRIIGTGAFYNCDSLTEVPFGKSVVKIKAYAFEDCDGFTDIVFPDNVTYIGERAFRSCENLKTVVIGEGVVYMGEYSFYGNQKLESFTVKKPNNWTVYVHSGYMEVGTYNFTNPKNSADTMSNYSNCFKRV